MNKEVTNLDGPATPIKWKNLPWYLIEIVILSQLIMYLDDALVLAYVLIPCTVFHKWAYSSNIKWGNNKRHFLVYIVTNMTFFILALLFVLEVISYEKKAYHSTEIDLLNTAIEFIATQNKK